ncbi:MULTISPECIES: nucleobase:cation symporter-2 family protein [Brucella]|uniref:Purine permease n=1 Tax=Brucella lupini TaxID=255457 RepID=A0A256GGQ5_9HYPH|nr:MULTISPECIES: nucleobase:cation symporter-2 family protein [Brucella]RNL47806.1 purine permease [Ochrobactrum sp. MH181795]KAB2703015.1 purine permease [Brucella lupini]KAB2724432.1 purine permease [Brucella anthropi]KAB2736498.1 purine permease [Brucella anthropi]KAB2792139.1 purine permease [Brucella anthropi]
MTSAIHPVDEILPAKKTLTLALQHVAVSYVGSVAVPLIIANALGFSSEETILLISATFFCSGIATLLQTIGFWRFGVRLPIMNGVAFSSVSAIIAIGSMPGVGIAGICGAVIAGGIFIMLIAPVTGHLRRFFPPVVTGCIVTAIGVQLLPEAYQWAGGGRGQSDFGDPAFLGVALLVLIVILAFNRFGSPLLKNLAVLFGMGAGALVAFLLGMGNLNAVGAAPWMTVPMPFHFGLPTFAVLPFMTIVIVMIVQTVESMGLFISIGEIVDKDVTPEQVADGVRANGLASAVAGIFAGFPFIAHMENVGLVILSGVRSRWVVALCGFMLCVIAFFPKFGAVLAAVPAPALGGAAVAMFGIVAAAGIQSLSKVDYANNQYNILIVALTLAIAFIPIMSPNLFQQLPDWTQSILHSSVVVACVVSVTLNLVLNGLGNSNQAHESHHDGHLAEAKSQTNGS